jgi:hypothetical protein
VRDELNDARVSVLLFHEMEVASLHDLDAPRVHSGEAWVDKDQILLAVPVKVKGTTSMLTQRALQSRLGKNEHRILIDIPPFRVQGNFYFVGNLRIEDALRRDQAPFGSLNYAEMTYLPDPSVSFAVDEIVFNTARVQMLCTEFEIE